MSGVVIGGEEIEVPGIKVVNFRDDPDLRLKLGEDGRRRRPAGKAKAPRVSLLVVHTTGGIPGGKDLRPQSILPGFGRSTDGGRRVVDQWDRDGRCAGAHLAVDHDGVGYCLADLLLETTFHATSVNDVSIGIEVVQGHAHAELYDGQCRVVVDLLEWLAIQCGIQMQIPPRYRGRPIQRLVDGGADYYGACGHRDQSGHRGAGDPGDYLMDCLATRGWQRVDLEIGEDIRVWKGRQAWLGMKPSECDGVPGPRTVEYLKRAGFEAGLWSRPPAERTDLPR